MRKSVLTILFFCFLTQLANAQLWKIRRFELVGGLGTAQLIGDIGGFNREDSPVGLKNILISQTRYQLNGGMRYRITQDINVRFGVTYAGLTSSDLKGSNPTRGLESVTTLFEQALIGEYYFIKNKTESSYLFSKGQGSTTGGIFRTMDFFVFAGIGATSFSVKGNDKLEAQAMNTETTGFTAVIPVGVGTSFIYSPGLNLGIDLGVRYPLTDYLDGYSSPYSKSNDFYYFINLSITYKMRTGPTGLPTFKK